MTSSIPEDMAAVAAGVDDAENAVLEGENAPDCMIAVDFIDKGVGMMVIDSKMCHMNLKPWADTINDVLAAPRANKLMEMFYALEGASFGGSTQNFHAKDDAVDNIGRYVAQSLIQGIRAQVLGATALAVPQSTSTQAVGNTKICQIYMQAAYLNGLCTLDN